jgi:hypothetical protein
MVTSRLALRAKDLSEGRSPQRGQEHPHTPVQRDEEQRALDGAGPPQSAPPCPHGLQQERLALHQPMSGHTPIEDWRVGTAQIVPAVMTLDHRLGVAGKLVHVDHRTTGLTAID